MKEMTLEELKAECLSLRSRVQHLEKENNKYKKQLTKSVKPRCRLKAPIAVGDKIRFLNRHTEVDIIVGRVSKIDNKNSKNPSTTYGVMISGGMFYSYHEVLPSNIIGHYPKDV